jgi:phosphate transport system permease protein
MQNMRIYHRRRRRNFVAVCLCFGATLFGLLWLVLILATLLYNGIGGISLQVFTESTRPHGLPGGLLNAIVGSLIMTGLAIVPGTLIGVFAGTYLAEYGRGTVLANVVRFINDILLSAPSIIIGLLVYQAVVSRTQRFSAWAGAAALAIIVIPVVLRTTEDMLLLVPSALREAGAALGMPRAFVIGGIAYRAARAGLITGVLLAVARISGETAPLLFTASSNQFFNSDLNAAMASLPVVIYDFARSPYPDLQQLAWTGALIITFAVLALSISARVLGAQRTAK